MRAEFSTEERELIEKRRGARLRRRVLACVVAAAAACTTLALVLPAISMTDRTFCGAEEHAHADACYETRLTCGFAEDAKTADDAAAGAVDVDSSADVVAGHIHSASCYAVESSLACGLEEGDPETSVVLHSHSSACYAEQKVLSCSLAEGADHAHSDACYTAESHLTCGLAEGEPEAPAATHSHSSSCYIEQSKLVCGLEEGASEQGEGSGQTLEGHVHSDACYSKKLECSLEEHEHALACYSDPTADLETAADWRATLPPAEVLTGMWGDDLITVAKSQLGYQESQSNYEVVEDQMKGYTRYGAWWGIPYGDWCAMYVSFCLEYAGIDEDLMPRDANCQNWIEALAQEEYGLWRPAGAVSLGAVSLGDADATAQAYEPKTGDLVFFDWGGDGVSDHIGIVVEYTPATAGASARIKTIEGNSSNEVRYVEYILPDSSIMGYGELPANPASQIAEGDIVEIDSTATGVVTAASTNGLIELNLYDYDGNVNANWLADSNWPGFQWSGGAYLSGAYPDDYNRQSLASVDFGNSMITDFDYSGEENAQPATSQSVANQGGAINVVEGAEAGDTNAYASAPLGMSAGADVVSRTLDESGYPEVLGAGSMAAYFSDSSFATKVNSKSVDGLFQRDEATGEYSYDSLSNHAQYANGSFTLRSGVATPNFIVYPFGNFLPFNNISAGYGATQVSAIGEGMLDDYIRAVLADLALRPDGASESQLADMLGMYRDSLQGGDGTIEPDDPWATWSAADAIADYSGAAVSDGQLANLYNIDWNVDKNYFFGMDMSMTFAQPEAGVTSAGQSAKFSFAGDDDVWVYVDGVLFLDLSGIHRQVAGEIDFAAGVVRYYAFDPASGNASSAAFASFTFEELLTAAGASIDGLNAAGTFADFSTHEIKLFYMERGSGSSVCRMSFNLPLLKENSISVGKEVAVEGGAAVIGDVDHRFQVLRADENGVKTDSLFIAANTPYTIYDSEGGVIGTGLTSNDGVVMLGAGQRAEFTGIKASAGGYYVRELLSAVEVPQYAAITANGEEASLHEGIVVDGEALAGFESAVRDAADGATLVMFTNTVDASQLGSLSVEKKAPVGSTDLAGPFEFLVSIGDVWTKSLKLSEGETATIEGILAGSVFTVTELTPGAYGLTGSIDYPDSAAVANPALVDASFAGAEVSGITVTGGEAVAVSFGTAIPGAGVNIPFAVTLRNADGQPHELAFALREVAGVTGAAIDGAAAQSKTLSLVGSEELAFSSFGLFYSQEEDLAAIELPAVFYYELSESVDPALDGTRIGYDGASYVIEVTVAEQGGLPRAAVTGVYQAGERVWPVSEPAADSAAASDSQLMADTISFSITLLGDLSITKQLGIVPDGFEAGAFAFEVALSVDNPLTPLADSYSATLVNADEASAETSIAFTEGRASVEIEPGQTLVIHGLPAGAAWSVAEVDTAGWYVTHAIGDAEPIEGNVTGYRILASSDNAVTFTNTTTYELPETGAQGVSLHLVGGAALILAAIIALAGFRRRGRE